MLQKNGIWHGYQKIRLTFFMYQFNLLRCFDSQVSDSCLKLLKKLETFPFFPTLNWFSLTQKLYFHLFTFCYQLEYFLVSKNVGTTKVIQGSLSFQVPGGCCLQSVLLTFLTYIESFIHNYRKGGCSNSACWQIRQLDKTSVTVMCT